MLTALLVRAIRRADSRRRQLVMQQRRGESHRLAENNRTTLMLLSWIIPMIIHSRAVTVDYPDTDPPTTHILLRDVITQYYIRVIFSMYNVIATLLRTTLMLLTVVTVMLVVEFPLAVLFIILIVQNISKPGTDLDHSVQKCAISTGDVTSHLCALELSADSYGRKWCRNAFLIVQNTF